MHNCVNINYTKYFLCKVDFLKDIWTKEITFHATLTVEPMSTNQLLRRVVRLLAVILPAVKGDLFVTLANILSKLNKNEDSIWNRLDSIVPHICLLCRWSISNKKRKYSLVRCSYLWTEKRVVKFDTSNAPYRFILIYHYFSHDIFMIPHQNPSNFCRRT